MLRKVLQIAFVGACIAAIAPNSPLQTSLAFSGLGYVATASLVPRLAPSFVKVGLKGRDRSKKGPVPEIAELMGVVASVVYLFLMFALIPFIFFKYLVSFNSIADDSYTSSNYASQYLLVSDNRLFPHNKLAEYLSAVLCLQSTVLLGLFDDLFDIRWRHKFFLPAVALLPLLIVYYVDFSVTSIVVPSFVSHFPAGEVVLELANVFVRTGNHVVTYVTGLSFSTLADDYTYSHAQPKLLDLGVFYYLYMALVAIFSPNSINILAGVNGLEVGQLLVLAVVFLVNDACYLLLPGVSQAAYDLHLFLAIFVVPFLGVSLGLFQHNFFPARVFVGDTYCYFSGMVFAIVGILGHFSKTLLIFLLPQIVNFVYLVPQLFHLVPCPRHRMPRFNEKDGLMYPSFGELAPNASKTVVLILVVLEKLGLIKLEREKGRVVRFSNMTIINLALVLVGPLREDLLCILLMAIQFAVGMTMVVVRHTVGPWLFGYDNLSWGVK